MSGSEASSSSSSSSKFRPGFLKSRKSLFRVRDSKPATRSKLAITSTHSSPLSNTDKLSNEEEESQSNDTNHTGNRLTRLFLLKRPMHQAGSCEATSSSSVATRMASLPASLSSPRLSSIPMATDLDDSNETSTRTSPHTQDEEDQVQGEHGLRSLPCSSTTRPTTRSSGNSRSPLRLPSPPPPNLSMEQQKRRHIIGSLVHSENNYVATLQRLINDYKRPLEESQPSILSSSKICTLFHRLPEILQTHLLFRIALTEAVAKWDKEEKMGDVFVANFSKAVVLEIYSDFINNFSVAMECAKQEAKRKSALADFLKVKQITAHDRVGFFGLMVKPVQRFPQFILLLQDLLKETPPGHGDRMALQLALTTLESLAEMLNERKRESEQFAAFRDKIRNIAGKSNTPLARTEANSISSNLTTMTTTRYLLKEDDVLQLEFNNAGLISRSKQRRLLLLNDLLLCVTVNGRSSDADFGSHTERLTLKWAAPVRDVEVVDGAAGGTLARLLAPGNGKRSSVSRSESNCSGEQAESLAQDMADLMHDFEVVSRIGALVNSLRCEYEGLTSEVTNSLLTEIQSSIRQKDEQMAYMDACCLQLMVNKDDDNIFKEANTITNSSNTNSSNNVISGSGGSCARETFTFQTSDPSIKKEWLVELHLAQLALDPNNSPGWDVLEQERSVSTKLPLFVRPVVIFHQPKRQSELTCGCSYTLKVSTPTRMLKSQTYLVLNATDGISSRLRVFTSNQSRNACLKELATIEMRQAVRAIVFVPGLNQGVAVNGPRSNQQLRTDDLVWVATDAQRLLLLAASEPDRALEAGEITLDSEATCITYHLDKVWVGLSNGQVAVYERERSSGEWNIDQVTKIHLDNDHDDHSNDKDDRDAPISCLLPINQWGLYVARGVWVHQIDALANNQSMRCFSVRPPSSSSSLSPGHVHAMAQSGVGLWIALRHSPTICLYHTETFRHLQDINIASNVRRVLAARGVSQQQQQRRIFVTAMSVAASRGLLWVGTNVGIALTVPLPRLEGVPIISGRANISYHAHFGPITFFLNVNTKVVSEVLFQSKHNDNDDEDEEDENRHLEPDNEVDKDDDDDFEEVEAIEEEMEEELEQESNTHQASHPSSIACSSTFRKWTALSRALPSNASTLTSSSEMANCSGKSRSLNARASTRSVRNPPRKSYTIASSSCYTESRRLSRTLPRSLVRAEESALATREASTTLNSSLNDVFDLYGELLNVRDYDLSDDMDLKTAMLRNETTTSTRRASSTNRVLLHKSDPELETLPNRVSTLDSRVRMKMSRPRSLDMSSWSMTSGATTTSSSSGCSSGAANVSSHAASPNVSRNASFQSDASKADNDEARRRASGTTSRRTTTTTTSRTTAGRNTRRRRDAVTRSTTSTTSKKTEMNRTVTTVMGGRGYINWRRAANNNVGEVNNTDAFLVIWEMKV